MEFKGTCAESVRSGPTAADAANPEPGHPSTADTVIDLLLRGLIRRSAARSDAVRRLAASMLECDPRLPELLQHAGGHDAPSPAQDVHGSAASTVSATSSAPEALDLMLAQRRACEAFALAWARSEVCVGAAAQLSEIARVLSGSAARVMIKFGLRCDVPASRAPLALCRLVACGLVFGEDAAHAAASAGIFGRQPRFGGGARGGAREDSLGTARLATWAFASLPMGIPAGGAAAVAALSAGRTHAVATGVWGRGVGGRHRSASASSGDGSLSPGLGLMAARRPERREEDAAATAVVSRGRGTSPRRGSQASTSSVSAGGPDDEGVLGPSMAKPGFPPGGVARKPGGHRSSSGPERLARGADA